MPDRPRERDGRQDRVSGEHRREESRRDDGGGRARPWKRRLRAMATERLGYKGAALFFALVLWLIVSAEEPAEEMVSVRFEPALDSTLRLQGPLPSVSALVIGRYRELLKLYAAQPVVRRVVRADVPDTLRLELSPEDVTLPPGVEARVIDVQPRAVTLHFASNASRVVPVTSALHVAVPDSGPPILPTPDFDPESVQVTGRRRAVSTLQSVTTIDTTLLVADTLPHYVALDTAGLGVRVRPRYVRVHFHARELPAAPADSAGPAPADSGSPAAPRTGAASGAAQGAARGAAAATGRP